MATTYNSILIRANTSDTGTIPRSGPFSGCPDIIPWQQTNVQDPQGTFGAATGSNTSYDKDPGQDIIANNVNYVYVRGKNTGSAAVNGSNTYLFYSPSNLILWPQQWMSNQYMIVPDPKSVGTPYVQMNAIPGAICVTPNPFVWLDPQPPAPGTHYCLITMTGSPDQIVAMKNSAMSIVSSQGLGAWIAANGGTGWRNVATVTTGSPDFSTLTNYQNLGPVAKVQFNLLCTNIPAGAQVAFSCPAPNTPTNGGTGFQPIALPYTVVPGTAGTTVASFSAGMTTQVIENYKSGFYYQYKSNGYPTPAGFNITMQAVVISTGNDELQDHTMVLADYVPEDTLIYHPQKQEFTQGLKFNYAAQDSDDPFDPPDDGNVTAAIIGSHSTQLPDQD